ncbi:MAG: hypothetical protein B6D62_03440, partial [Candidatus Cloacimonas sp. 4484_275]
MFENLLSKVVSGIVSFSMLLLSSYRGNDADFSEITAKKLSSGILIQTNLQNAFENDFEQVFKCGQEINVFFELKIRSKNDKEFSQIFRHSVKFFPMRQYYSVFLEEAKKHWETDNFEEMKKIISRFEFEFYQNLSSETEIEISAFLPKISLDSSEKKFDLMMLWN